MFSCSRGPKSFRATFETGGGRTDGSGWPDGGGWPDEGGGWSDGTCRHPIWGL